MDKVATEQFQEAFVSGLKALEDAEVKTAHMVQNSEPFAKLARFYDLIPAEEELNEVSADADAEAKTASLGDCVSKLRELRK